MAVVDTDLLLRNRVLRTVHHDELLRFAELFEVREYGDGQEITDRAEQVTDVIFPIDAVFSVVAESSQGHLVEAGTIGNEGVVGLAPFLGGESSLLRTICQVPGTGLSVPTKQLLGRGDGAISMAARRYALAFMTMASQGAACNRLHPIEQRAARWLLMVHDRQPADTFRLTHEFFAMMLGASRPTVTGLAARLRDDGLISYTRGNVTMIDRPRVERLACECYGVITDEYERSVGMALRKRKPGASPGG